MIYSPERIRVRVEGEGEGVLPPPAAPTHQRRDVYRGLLMHAGLLLFVVVCCCCCRRTTGGSGLTSSRVLDSTVTLLRPNGDASMGLDDQAMR